MVDQHLSLPTFSFAPDRDGPNGYFSVGGIPPVNTTGKTASASILTVSYHSPRESEDVSLANHEIDFPSRARIPVQSLPSTNPTTTTSTSMMLSLEGLTPPHSPPLSTSWIPLPHSLCSPAVKTQYSNHIKLISNFPCCQNPLLLLLRAPSTHLLPSPRPPNSMKFHATPLHPNSPSLLMV
jgi:hypothetical protein